VILSTDHFKAHPKSFRTPNTFAFWQSPSRNGPVVLGLRMAQLTEELVLQFIERIKCEILSAFSAAGYPARADIVIAEPNVISNCTRCS